MIDSPLTATGLEKDHRRLDELFGLFLAASNAADLASALEAMERFDDALRRHTEFEERNLYPEPVGHKLVAGESESESERLARELRLEHVQIREVSGMMRRLLSEKRDLAGARSLAGNLARRWEAHTIREERDVFPKLLSS